MRPFETWAQVETIAAEIDPRYAAIPVVLAGTGLRPEELWALERRDVDLDAGRPLRRARLLAGRVEGAREVVPPAKARPAPWARRRCAESTSAEAGLAAVVPGREGRLYRRREVPLPDWAPALRAAGIEHRRVYDCRHTFASWAIAGGVQLFYLARIMGTSVAQIDATYGHLLPDSEEYLRGLLDAYDAATAAEGAR